MVEKVPESVRELIMANPLVAILEQARHWLIDPTSPGFANAIGGWPQWLLPVAVLVASCAFGLWIFNRESSQSAERL